MAIDLRLLESELDRLRADGAQLQRPYEGGQLQYCLAALELPETGAIYQWFARYNGAAASWLVDEVGVNLDVLGFGDAVVWYLTCFRYDMLMNPSTDVMVPTEAARWFPIAMTSHASWLVLDAYSAQLDETQEWEAAEVSEPYFAFTGGRSPETGGASILEFVKTLRIATP
jgi:hypothetical protein